MSLLAKKRFRNTIRVIVGILLAIIISVAVIFLISIKKLNLSFQTPEPTVSNFTSKSASQEISKQNDLETREPFYPFSNKFINWSKKISYYPAPSLGKNAIYIKTADHTLTALNKSNGSTMWTFKAPGQITLKHVTSNTIIMTANLENAAVLQSSAIYAIDGESGKLLWEHVIDRFTKQKILDVTDQNVYVFDYGTNSKKFQVIDIQSGDIEWSYTSGYIKRHSDTGCGMVREGIYWGGNYDSEQVFEQDDDVIYLLDNDSAQSDRCSATIGFHLLALDRQDGTVLWEEDHNKLNAKDFAALDSRVYYISDNIIVAKNAASGKTLWEASDEDNISNIYVYGNTLLVQKYRREDTSYSIAALSTETGQKQWSFSANGRRMDTLSDQKRVYLYTEGGYDNLSEKQTLFALDPLSGDKIWEVDIVATLHKPTILNGYIYVGDTRGNLYKIATDTGKVAWHISEPNLEAIVIAQDGSYRLALNPSEASRIVESRSDKFSSRQIIFNEDTLYTFGEEYRKDAKIAAYDLSTGKRIWSLQQSPTISRLLVDVHDNMLYFYGENELWSVR